MGSEGKIIPFDERNHLDERLTQFFDMEYNGITAADDYLPELFQIAK